jgi:4-amino-4-deoxy-L-arabinose transferase-like glycosyltransferase
MLRAAVRRGPEALALAAVVALAAVLRFAKLADRGLIYWDEGKFALEGIRLQSAIALLSGAHADLIAGKAVGTAKPTHAFLIALAYDIFGIHDYAALYVDALAGVICVVLTYAIGRRLFGPVAGLVAAALLAVSEYEAIYARSALSESDATVFLLFGVAIWVCSSSAGGSFFHRRLLALSIAGVSFGVGLTINYRLIIYIAVVVAIDAIHELRSSGWERAGVRLLAWVFGLILAPLLWEVAGTVAQGRGLVLFRGEVIRDPLPYWRELIYQLHQGKQSVLHFNPAIYVQWWVLRQGWIVSALLLAALVRAGHARSRQWLVPAALVVVPYVIFVFAPFVVPRNMVPALPFASILVAALLVDAGRRSGRLARGVGLLLFLGLLALGAAATWRLTSVRSGFVSAVRYVDLIDSGRALTSSEIPVFYLRGSGATCAAPAMPYNSGDLRAFIRDGFHYALLDRHNNSNLTAIVRRVERRVARFPALGHVDLGESLISSENSNPPAGDARTEYINVYYLDPARLPPAPLGHPAPCRRDRVV